MAKPRLDKSLAARRDYLTRGRDASPIGRPLRHLTSILEVNSPSVALEFSSSVSPTIDALGTSAIVDQPRVEQIFGVLGGTDVGMDEETVFSRSDLVVVIAAHLRHTDPISRTLRMSLEVVQGGATVNVCVAHSEVARSNFFNLALLRPIYLVRGMRLVGDTDAMGAGETVRLAFLYWNLDPGAYVVGLP